MKRDRLSLGQWGALLWAAAMAPAAEMLPGPALEWAGKGAWLAPVAAMGILLPLLRLSHGGDAVALRDGFFRKIILLVGAVWMEVLVTLRLVLCARRMLWSGERDGAVWYFLLTLAALALWIGEGRLSALGRAGQIFLVFLLGVAALVLGLSLPRVRADRILPLWTGDIGLVLRAALPAAGNLCWAVLPMQLLPVQTGGGRGKLLWGAGGCLLLTLAQSIIIGNLGVGLSSLSGSAFFALTKSVGVEGAFQRVESVVSALWMLSDLTVCVILTHAIGLVGEDVMFHVKREMVSSIALLAGAGMGLWLLRWGAPVEEWNRDWVWLGNLLTCAMIAVAIRWGSTMGKKTKSG